MARGEGVGLGVEAAVGLGAVRGDCVGCGDELGAGDLELGVAVGESGPAQAAAQSAATVTNTRSFFTWPP